MNAGEWIFNFFRNHRGLPFRSMAVFNYLLEAALFGGILVLLMLAARKLLRKRLGSRVIWAAWLLVAIRLLVPLALPNPLMNELRPTFSYDAAARPVADQFRVRFQDATIDLGRSLSPEGVTYFGDGNIDNEDVTAGNIVYNLGVYTSYGWMGKWFLIGYAVIGSGVALWMLGRNIAFRRRLQRNTLGGIPAHLHPYYLQLCAELKVEPVPVDIVDPLPGPCLTGVFRPFIALPLSMPEEEVMLALRHELCHLKGRDHLWALLRNLCCAVQWFNPLVWLGAKLSREDCELACDERVSRFMSDYDRQLYARTLVQTAARRNTPGLTVCATGMTFNGRRMKARVREILQNRTIRRWAVNLFAVAAVIVVLTAFFTAETKAPSAPLYSINDYSVGFESIDAFDVAQVPGGYGLIPAMTITDEASAVTQAMRYLGTQCFYSAGYTINDTANNVDWCVMPASEGWYVSILYNRNDMTLMLLDKQGRLLQYNGDVLRQEPIPHNGVLPDNTDEAILSHIQRFATGCMNVASVTDYQRIETRTLGGYSIIVTAEATLDGVRYSFDMNMDTQRFWRVRKLDLNPSVRQTQADVLARLNAWVNENLFARGSVDSSQLLVSMRWDDTIQHLRGVVYIPATACSEEVQVFLSQTFDRAEAYLLHFLFYPYSTDFEAIEQVEISLSAPGLTLNNPQALPMYVTVYTLVADRWLVKQEAMQKGTAYIVLDTMNVHEAGVVPVGYNRDVNMTKIAFQRFDGSIGSGWVTNDQLVAAIAPTLTPEPNALDSATIDFHGSSATIDVFVKHRVYDHFADHAGANLTPEEALSLALEALNVQCGLSLETMTQKPVEYGYVTDTALPYWQIDTWYRDDPTALYSVHVRDEDGVILRVYWPQDGNG